MTHTAKLGGMRLELLHIADLAPRVREQDRVDCARHAQDPGPALLSGLKLGPAWAITWENQIIGAGGYTFTSEVQGWGTIWSLWADLSSEQSRAVMSRAPLWIHALAKDANRPLYNVCRADNRLTLAWLRASHCFDIGEELIPHEGADYLAFYVKPVEELARNV